jgi:hypothetical protein
MSIGAQNMLNATLIQIPVATNAFFGADSTFMLNDFKVFSVNYGIRTTIDFFCLIVGTMRATVAADKIIKKIYLIIVALGFLDFSHNYLRSVVDCFLASTKKADWDFSQSALLWRLSAAGAVPLNLHFQTQH